MKKHNLDPADNIELHIRPRESENVPVKIPKEILASLKKVAESRDMSVQALLKLSIGQGLRQDISRLFGDQVLETTAQVLANISPLKSAFLLSSGKFVQRRGIGLCGNKHRNRNPSLSHNLKKIDISSIFSS